MFFVKESLSSDLRESGEYAGLPSSAIVEETPLRYLLTEFPLAEGMWRHAIQVGIDGVIGDFGSFTIDEVDSFVRRGGQIHAGETRVVLSTTNETPFIHLHAHSEYSPLDGLASIQEMVDTVAAQGQSAIAVTDHGVCAGHLELQRVAQKTGIKPIFGIEANFIDHARDKSPELRGAYKHFILLAKNQRGLHNLWRASTMAHQPDRFYGRSRMDWDILEQCGEGLIASSACLRGPLSDMILDGDESEVIRLISRFKGIFGDDFYLELHLNQLEQQKKINEALISLGQTTSTPLIVVGDSHYSCEEHADAHTVWIAAQTNKDLQDEADLFSGHEQYHLHTVEDAKRALSYLPSTDVDAAIAMTQTIADQCDATIKGKGGTPVYHRHQQPDAEAQFEELDNVVLDRLCREAMDSRFPENLTDEQRAVYMARYEEEMEALRSKGFSGYMLIVWDYCLDPSTPVLTQDLRWVEVGKLEPGDRLMGFDEDKVTLDGGSKGHRRWHGTEVVDTKRIVLPTYRVTLADGTETVTSEDHQWLISSPGGSSIRWVKTKDLRLGQRAQRLLEEWDEPDTWDAGYVSGILDGEGHLTSTPNNNGGRQLTLGFSQNRGVVLDNTLRILDSWGFDYAVRDHSSGSGVQCVNLSGGRSEVMRLLGMTRPQRLLEKFDPELLGRVRSVDQPAIVSIEPLGPGEVVALKTTTGTLVAHGFAHHNCNWCRDHDILMGPGRGSAAGSIVSYLLGITQVDPIEAGLLFERFISPGRTELPDIDSDFPQSKRSEITNYLVERWGEEHVVRVGTVTRLRNKGVFKDVARVLKGSPHEVAFADQEKISKLIDEAEASTAGLGLPWDELWDQEEEALSAWKERYPELFKYAEILVGRLKSYGKHPAGVVIDPSDPIADAIPLRQGEDEHPVTEFPMEVLDELGLVKFDILTLRTLDTIQECMDLIRDDPNCKVEVAHPHTWRKQYEDPQVWDMICNDGDTLGIFQIETSTGTRLTERFKPRSIADLCAILTLVRPGPMRSGLTDSYIRRRDGREPVTYAHPLLEPVLKNTYGTMIYQEDIMGTVKVIAGYDSAEADQVRKILGKKKVDKVAAEGQRFVSRSVERGVDRQVAEHMFRQMEEFARYSFNKSHSWAYAMLAYWCAWFKCHYPAHFIVASLSTADKDRFPEFVMDAERKGYSVRLPDVNESGITFTVTEDGLGIRYGLSSIKGLGQAAAQGVIEGRPYTDLMDFIDRRDARKCNYGNVKLLAHIGVLDNLAPEHNRAEIEDYIDQLASGKLEECAHLKPGCSMGEEIAVGCGFDWLSEPRPVGKSGKPLKAKPIPKKCSKACRQYLAAPAVRWRELPAPTDREIRSREREKIGLYVSSTPFDNINLDDPAIATYDQLLHGENARYMFVGEVRSVRTRDDKMGRKMAFTTILVPGGEVQVTVFSSAYKDYGLSIKPNTLAWFSVDKNDRGLTLNNFIPTQP